jgi:hypothetical protein
MKAYFLILLCMALARVLPAQGFEVIFGEASGTVIDQGFRLLEIPGEHAYLVFSKRSGGPGEGIVITKINSSGQVVWEKRDEITMPISNLIATGANDGLWVAYDYSNNNTNERELVIKEYNFEGAVASSHSYVLPDQTVMQKMFFFPDFSVGCIASLYIPDETRLFKVSKNAELLWSKTFPNADINIINSDPGIFTFVGTPDEGFLTSTLLTDADYFTKFSKFDAQGNLQWQNQDIPNASHDLIIPLPLSQGDGYLVWRIRAVGLASKLYKIDETGQLLWEKDFFEHANYHGSHLMGTNNSYYIYGSVKENNIPTPCLLQIDENGEVLWEKRYDTNIASGSGQLTRVGDGGFFVPMSKNPAPGTLNAPHAMKTDANGELVWSWSNTTYDEHYQQVQPLVSSYGEYLMLGTLENIFIEDYQNILIRLDFLSALQPNAKKSPLVSVFPQPSVEEVIFRLDDNLLNTQIDVFNLLGQRLHTQPVKGGDNRVTGLPTGQLFYCLRQNGAVVAMGKVVVR